MTNVWPPGGASVPFFFLNSGHQEQKSNNNPGQEFYPKITHGLIFKMFVTAKKKKPNHVYDKRGAFILQNKKLFVFIFWVTAAKFIESERRSQKLTIIIHISL